MNLFWYKSIKKLLLLWVFFLFAVFIFFIPPFQKPDEVAHFYRATALAKGELFCKDNKKGEGYFIIPRNFFAFPEKTLAYSIRYHYENKFPKNVLFGKQDTDNTDTKVKGICSLSFTGYFTNTLGVGIGLLLNNPLIAIYLGRLTACIFFLVCFYIAIKNIPKKYKLILCFFTAIPMVLHQVTAISYDTTQLSLIILVFSLLIKYLSISHISLRQITIFTVLLVLFSLAKAGYYPLLLLYFLIPYRKITSRFINYILITAIMFLPAIIVNILFAKSIVSSMSNFNLVSPKLQIKFMLQNPSTLPSLIMNTFSINGEFYYKSLVGIFGWLDYGLNFFIYIAFAVVFSLITYLLIKDSDIPIINKKQLSLLTVIIASVLSVIFLVQYIGWTTVALDIIQGVQGRYFLVLLPFFMFAIVQFALIIGKKNFYALLAIIFSVFLVFDLVLNIYNRYYNYSYLYSDQGFLEKNIKQLKIKNSSKLTIPIRQQYYLVENLSPDRKIGGFEFIFSSPSKVMKTPYEYYIKDGQCNKTYKKGFLDIENLQSATSPKIYDEEFGSIIKPPGSKMCVELIPFEKPVGGQYINLYSLSNEMQFEFLLIAN